MAFATIGTRGIQAQSVDLGRGGIGTYLSPAMQQSELIITGMQDYKKSLSTMLNFKMALF